MFFSIFFLPTWTDFNNLMAYIIDWSNDDHSNNFPDHRSNFLINFYGIYVLHRFNGISNFLDQNFSKFIAYCHFPTDHSYGKSQMLQCDVGFSFRSHWKKHKPGIQKHHFEMVVSEANQITAIFVDVSFPLFPAMNNDFPLCNFLSFNKVQEHLVFKINF